ncbi:uncharacterized protein MELLADRAFT_60262 [Melampsora larici-populina 98AG31]|uniref:Uncharacterized protein n=1 Tax=Melampsora larici-populina (strain 98AG31 / pathotype 3-4-7) TaxID=747676 RepID=F4RAP2_MELLP|nr:uncharacterized protein MELLADRAFT_60262 [Melampsora larici-populina 98AG31]EGG10749.1 hypothetical protein MELLADRAFT_60262 [Melampsora larici-populina 98AG31]
MYHFHGFAKRKEVKPRLMTLILFMLTCLTPSFISTGFNLIKNKEKILPACETDLTEASSSTSEHLIRIPENEIVEVNDLSYRSNSDDLPIYPNLQTQFSEYKINGVILQHLQGLIGGDQIWSMNYLIDHMRNLIATKNQGIRFMINVFKEFITSESNPLHYARVKVALSTLLRNSAPDEFYQPHWKWEVHKMVAFIEREFRSHPEAASSVWNPNLPPESFIIRDLYDPILALETEARRAHYIITTGGKHISAHELRNASADELKETVSGIEKALQKKDGEMKDLTSADEMTLLKALYVIRKEMKGRVKIDIITSEMTLLGGSTTCIYLPKLCHEATKMAVAFSELVDVAHSPVTSIAIHMRATRMNIALRAFTPQRLLQLHGNEPVFQQMILWKNQPSLLEIKNLLNAITEPKLLELDERSMDQSHTLVEIFHSFLIYLGIVEFENVKNSSVLYEVVKTAKILAQKNGMFVDLEIALTARLKCRYPWLAHYFEITGAIQKSLHKV